nr:nascent polypeptide-associated complex subunit alpha, muscle-specific form-like [Aegilops tauschii subsp. strangulata]
MPVFNEHRLVSPVPAEAPVVLSSGDSGEEEGPDLEATQEGAGETSPRCMTDLLRAFPDDDDDANDHPVRESLPPAGVTTRSKVTPSKKPLVGVPTKSRSALISRGGAPTLTPTGAAAEPAAAPSSAPGTRTPVPQAAKPSCFVLQKRPRDYAAIDQPMLVAKKKREGAAAPSRTQHPATAAPPLARKGGEGARASPARSSSRGPEDRPQEKTTSTAKSAPEAPAPSSPAEVPKVQEPPVSSVATNSQALVMTLSPPPPIMPQGRDPSASPDALEEALSALTQLRDDLQGANRRLASGRLELILGWLRSDASVKAARSQAIAASKEGERPLAWQLAWPLSPVM